MQQEAATAQRTPCTIEGCTISAEEHHRVNVGLVNENASLRTKLRNPAGDTDVDLSAVSDMDLALEFMRRMQSR